MSKKIRATVSFTPVDSILALAGLPDVGKAGYGARIVVDGKEQPSIEAGPSASSLTIEVHEGASVVLLLAARDRDGNHSPATPFEFKAGTTVPPKRPTGIFVSGLDIVEAAPIGKPVQLNISDEAVVFNITTKGHVYIKDGAVGTVVGYDPTKNQVVAIFPDDAMKAGYAPAATGHEFAFGADDSFDAVQVLAPDQTMMSLAEYVETQKTLAATA